MSREESPQRKQRAGRRIGVAAAWLGTVAIVGAAAFLAGRWTFNPPESDQPDAIAQSIAVAEGTVGETLAVTVEVSWKQSASGINPASGTVTTTPVRDKPTVDAGDTLYTVDLRPVVAAAGEVPSFRDLAQGVKGLDVAQLQHFLLDSGYYAGPTDGTFGKSTTAAVKAWQRALGVEATGMVAAGDLLFFPQLPARVIAKKELVAGAVVTAGQELLSVVDAAPVFTARLGSEQLGRIGAASVPIVIMGPGTAPWNAVTGSIRIDDSGNAILELLPAAGESICGDECGLLELTESAQILNASAILTPDVSGPIVPVSAIGTDPNGGAFVVALDGSRIPVTVRGSDGAQAVIDGVDIGDTIRLFAIDAADDGPARPQSSAEAESSPEPTRAATS